MTSQIIFKIDKKLKEKAMARAQSEGIAFASILKLATKAFVDGDLHVGLFSSENFNKTSIKEIERVKKDIAAKKNISKSFTSASAAVKYLKS